MIPDLVQALVNKIAENINEIDINNLLIVKYEMTLNEPMPNRYIVNIVPAQVISNDITSHSSYPSFIFHIEVLYFIPKDTEDISQAHDGYFEVFNKIYDKLNHNTFGDLVSVAIIGAELLPSINSETVLVIHKRIRMEYREYSYKGGR